MGRISTSIGLITGTPIQDTVDQLIKISGAGRDMLSSRVEALRQEQTAITDLTVKSISTQLAARAFGSSAAFQRTKATSSQPDVLSATRSGSPAAGSYSIQTLQVAGSQGFKTASFASAGNAIGTAGSLTIRGGGYADRSMRLEQLNAGRGVAAGAIRITDRSGQVATIDLSTASTVDDVIQAINDAPGVRLHATTVGDAIRIDDLSGASAANLRVEEVGGGSTAADLGLRGIDIASTSATGSDILRLSGKTRLETLRDGRGIGFGDGNDIEITFRNGTAIAADFGDFSRPASYASGSTDNATANARLSFTAKQKGSTGDGVLVRFIDDGSVVAGQEKSEIIDGPNGREVVFTIDEGATTAAQVAAAVGRNSDVSALLGATTGGDGQGLVSLGDTAVLGGGAEIATPTAPTIDDLLRVLNQIAPDRLAARLSGDGDGIELEDLTTGGLNFYVTDAGSSTVAADLGIDGVSTTGLATSSRLSSGLRGVSLDALAGGAGLGTLGSLQISTHDGSTAAIDLSAASTMQDVLNAINDSALNVEASLDPNGAAIRLRDLSSGVGNLSVTSGDATAERLGLAQSTSDSLILGDNLDLQFVDRSTRLETLNQGRGVGSGTFQIRDSQGRTSSINLKSQKIITVGGLIDAINALGLSATAAINETGDGIRLTETESGSFTLSITDTSGNSAADLGLSGTATQGLVDGSLVKTINARQADVITFASSDSLTTIADRIRETSRFATASVVGGESGTASLSILSRRGGEAGRISIQDSALDFGIQETSRGRDAVLLVGEAGGAASSVFRSADGVFTSAIEGVTLTAKNVSTKPITIDIAADYSSLESSVGRFVEQYNNLVGRVAELSAFNPATNEVGLLFGTNEALRIPGALARVVSGSFSGTGTIRSSSTVGIRLNKDGKLEFDKAKFQAAIDDDPRAVEEFLTAEDSGFVDKIEKAIDRIAGEDRSLLINRTTNLSAQIGSGERRIGSMNEQLESERNRLLKQFYAMESAIAKMQNNQQYMSRIKYFDSSGQSS